METQNYLHFPISNTLEPYTKEQYPESRSVGSILVGGFIRVISTAAYGIGFILDVVLSPLINLASCLNVLKKPASQNSAQARGPSNTPHSPPANLQEKTLLVKKKVKILDPLKLKNGEDLSKKNPTQKTQATPVIPSHIKSTESSRIEDSIEKIIDEKPEEEGKHSDTQEKPSDNPESTKSEPAPIENARPPLQNPTVNPATANSSASSKDQNNALTKNLIEKTIGQDPEPVKEEGKHFDKQENPSDNPESTKSEPAQTTNAKTPVLKQSKPTQLAVNSLKSVETENNAQTPQDSIKKPVDQRPEEEGKNSSQLEENSDDSTPASIAFSSEEPERPEGGFLKTENTFQLNSIFSTALKVLAASAFVGVGVYAYYQSNQTEESLGQDSLGKGIKLLSNVSDTYNLSIIGNISLSGFCAQGLSQLNIPQNIIEPKTPVESSSLEKIFDQSNTNQNIIDLHMTYPSGQKTPTVGQYKGFSPGALKQLARATGVHSRFKDIGTAIYNTLTNDLIPTLPGFFTQSWGQLNTLRNTAEPEKLPILQNITKETPHPTKKACKEARELVVYRRKPSLEKLFEDQMDRLGETLDQEKNGKKVNSNDLHKARKETRELVVYRRKPSLEKLFKDRMDRLGETLDQEKNGKKVNSNDLHKARKETRELSLENPFEDQMDRFEEILYQLKVCKKVNYDYIDPSNNCKKVNYDDVLKAVIDVERITRYNKDHNVLTPKSFEKLPAKIRADLQSKASELYKRGVKPEIFFPRWPQLCIAPQFH